MNGWVHLALGAWLAGLTAGCESSSRPNRARTVVIAPPVVLAEPTTGAPALLEPSPLALSTEWNATAIPIEPRAPGAASESNGVAQTHLGDMGGPIWPKEWANVWLPLESWGRFNGLGKPMRLISGGATVFQLQSSNGLVLIKMGSHNASIAGLEYGLGFAPRLIRGFPYIHSLDAQKTLQVLLGVFLPLSGKSRTVVIDPGHGGRDSGARSVAAHELEKNYTLDWALRLQHRLQGTSWNVILTRTNDVDLPLAERIAVADRSEADLFVSLHLNSGGANKDLAGVETYCLTPMGMPSNLLRTEDDDPRETHPNNQFDDQNVQLATRLHRCFLQVTGAMDRGVKRARFMAVLRGQHRPAVLIEGGYLSNPGEARKLANPEYRQTMAEGVARGLLE